MTRTTALTDDQSARVLRMLPTAYTSDEELLATWHTLRRATTALEVRLNEALLTMALPTQSIEALAGLARVPDHRLTMSRLATSLGVTSGGLTKLVDRLVQDGFVHRQYSEQDRRVVYAVLTDAGLDLSRRAMPVYAAHLRTEFGPLGRVGLGELRAVCHGLAGRDSARPR